MLNTALTQNWGLKHPLILAPMANTAGGELAAAVTRAGGLGLFGIGSTTATAWIAAEAAKVRPAGIWGAGLMTWALETRPDLLEALLAEKPDVVSLSFGDPTPFVEQVRDAGAKLVAQVQDRESAIQALDAGVDAVIAQGTEAGGHTGSVGTMTLVQIVLELAAERGVPVLAAGGIATGRGIAGALAMGCAGVWVGTPFVATEEALGSEAAKSRVLRAKETETIHTHVFDILTEAPWPDAYPGRALVNDLTTKWHGHEDDLTASFSEAQAEFADARKRDDYTKAHIYAGQSVGLIREVVPAERLVARLMVEAEALLRGTSGLVS